MAGKVGTSERPHSTNNATAFTYRRRGESAYPKQYSPPPHNGAMTAMYYSDAATDVANLPYDSLANPSPAAPFYHFGA